MFEDLNNSESLQFPPGEAGTSFFKQQVDAAPQFHGWLALKRLLQVHICLIQYQSEFFSGPFTIGKLVAIQVPNPALNRLNLGSRIKPALILQDGNRLFRSGEERSDGGVALLGILAGQILEVGH